MMKLLIVIKLFFLYIKWCYDDCIANAVDIQIRYEYETNKDFKKEIDNL